MKAKKILATLMCAVLLVSASVAGTLAYLTFTTNEVENTFTIGKVNLGTDGQSGLDEADVNEYGELLYVSGEDLVTKDKLPQGTPEVLADRVTENTYKLIPGHKYVKDPTLHILEGSEPCYVFVKVENGIADIEAADTATIANQMVDEGWGLVPGETDVFYKANPVDARDEDKDVVVFRSFTLSKTANATAYKNAKITVIGYAIQADGFASATEAWAAAPSSWGNTNP